MTGRRHALVGVLGHVDHGKTALVRALTGTDTDRLPEEKARGISIALGFARLEAPCGAEVELVDAPGHERFVRAMVAGATAIDSALLAVDAREGARAQTAEHAEVAALLGVRRGVVAVARRDLADAGRALAAAEGARALLARLGLGADWPVVETSAATGEGMAELAAALGGLAREEAPGGDGEAWLPLDRAFALAGAGVVATGALRRGRLSVGDAVEVLPRGLRASIRSIHSHGRALDRVGPGRRVAVALRGVERRDVAPGDALAAPGLGLAASALLDARVAVLPSAPRALARGEPLRLLIGTREVGARLRPLGRDRVEPGEEAVAQLALDAPVAVPARERFVLRLPSPPRTVGGGEVLDPAPLRRRRGRDAAALDALAGAADPFAALSLRLREAGPRGLPPGVAARAAGLPAPALSGAMEAFVRLSGPDGGARLLHAGAVAELEDALLAAVEAAQRVDPLGGGPEAGPLLRAALPRGAPAGAVAARLVARGALALSEGRLRLRGLDAARLLPDADRALVASVEAAYRDAGLAPPDARAAAAGRDPRRVAGALRLLLRAGVLLRAVHAGREVLFHREALDRARAALRAALAARPEGLTVSECDALLGISRRHGVPLLELMDAQGFTRREGDRRRLAEAPFHRAG